MTEYPKHYTVRSIVAALLAITIGFAGTGLDVALAQNNASREITTDDIFALMEKGKVTTATKSDRELKKSPLAVTVITDNRSIK